MSVDEQRGKSALPEGWMRVRQALESARELAPSERGPFLDREVGVRGQDRELVDELLAADQVEDGFLDSPTGGAAGRPTLDPARWIGGTFGSYEVRRLIASGGMGAVYEAQQLTPNRRVALKVMHTGMDAPSAMRRFRHEAELLARLKHAGIAQVYEAGVLPESADGAETPWIALELVEGASTITTYARDKDLGLRERLEMFLVVCDAVHHGHQRGIVHRDLKPANILVGRGGEPKVIDFGIAKAMDRGPGEVTDQTLQGEIVGTLLYMSPEQIRGQVDEVDTRTDAFALGVVLYELICEAPTFQIKGASIAEAAHLLTGTEPVAPSRRMPGVPRDLDWIVAKAMALDLNQRYRSVAELADDLGRLLRHEPVSAGPPSTAYHLRKFVRRHRLGVTAAAIALLGVLGGLVWALRAERIADAERALAVGEAAKAKGVEDFLIDVLSAPSPLRAGRDVRVMDVLSRAAEEYSERFRGQPDVRVRVAKALGAVYHGLGLRGESAEELERALAFARALEPGPALETAAVLGNLGVVRLDEADFEAAEACLVESIEMLRGLSPGSEAFHGAQVRLGRLRFAQERFEEAEALLRDGVAGIERHASPDSRAPHVARNILAGLLHERGELDEAEVLYRKSLAGLSALMGEDHPDTLGLRFNVAMLVHSRGPSQASMDEIEQIIAVRRRVLGPDHPDTIVAIINLAGMYLMAERLEDAAALYVESLDDVVGLMPEGHPLLQTLRVNRAQLARSTGDLSTADELLRGVFRERERSNGIENEQTQRVLFELTSLARERGELLLAEERALIGLDGASGFVTRPTSHYYLFQLELGRIWTLMGRFDDAEAILLESFETFEAIEDRLQRTPRPEPALAALYRTWGKLDLAAEYADAFSSR